MTGDTRQETRVQEGAARLDAWRLSDDLAVEVFQISRSLPRDLRWLASQIARAATSVPANISEGYARTSKKEFHHYLSIARGSLAEVEYFLHSMHRTELIDTDAFDRVSNLRRRLARRCSD